MPGTHAAFLMMSDGDHAGFEKAWFTSVRICSHVFILDPFSVHGEEVRKNGATFHVSGNFRVELSQ
jgi:hypothetical protein